MCERREEIEQTALVRVCSIADPIEVADAEYVAGLKLAVSKALDYALDAIDQEGEQALLVPTTLLAQARLAARSGVNLDTVLRRYFAGYTLFGDFLVQEAERISYPRADLQILLRVQAMLFDRLVAAVSEEFGREPAQPSSIDERRAETVRRLLAGDPIDAPELQYDLNANHLGLIAAGRGAERVMRALAAELDCRLLFVLCTEEKAWAWLGRRLPFDPMQLERLSAAGLPCGLSLAIGEPAEGRNGWRMTHHQAKAALSIALRASGAVRYREAALLSSITEDELLVAFLRDTYLAPLSSDHDNGGLAIETLRAYFAAERNISSAAAALGVSRQAVRSRLRTVESRIGHDLGDRAVELELALRIYDLDTARHPPAGQTAKFPASDTAKSQGRPPVAANETDAVLARQRDRKTF